MLATRDSRLATVMKTVTSLNVNGKTRPVDADPGRTLLSVLRNDLDLTGAKYGCGEGQCGACTVLIDGLPVRSCSTAVASAAGKRITTIEGLAQGDNLHPVQQAFIDTGAMQCGYCIPGMILAAAALLKKSLDPSDAEIAVSMHGNLCRCGSYPRITSAIRLAAHRMRPEAK